MNPNFTLKMNHTDAKAPRYSTIGSAGADLYAVFDDVNEIVLPPMARVLVSTGLSIEVDSGYEVQIRSRSGMAFKSGVIVLNSPGTIDSDYRGEIGVLLINFGDEDFVIKTSDRIAQMVVAKVDQADFTLGAKLSETDRGEGGFGSTGQSD